MNARARRRAGAFSRFPSLPVRDVLLAARAEWYLLRARLSLILTPRGRLLTTTSAPPGAEAPNDDALARVGRLGLAVDRAAEYGVFTPTCLVRAIALERMLQRDGVTGAVVRIGARRRGERPEMHAWVELGGTVVGDRPDVAGTFTPLHDFTAARRA